MEIFISQNWNKLQNTFDVEPLICLQNETKKLLLNNIDFEEKNYANNCLSAQGHKNLGCVFTLRLLIREMLELCKDNHGIVLCSRYK